MKAIKRKGKGGKRCRGGARVAGKADAMDRISAWQAEASGDVADRLEALRQAMAGMADAAPQHLRQDW